MLSCAVVFVVFVFFGSFLFVNCCSFVVRLSFVCFSLFFRCFFVVFSLFFVVSVVFLFLLLVFLLVLVGFFR